MRLGLVITIKPSDLNLKTQMYSKDEKKPFEEINAPLNWISIGDE